MKTKQPETKIIAAINREPNFGIEKFFTGTLGEIQDWMEAESLSLGDTYFFEVGKEVHPKLVIAESK